MISETPDSSDRQGGTMYSPSWRASDFTPTPTSSRESRTPLTRFRQRLCVGKSYDHSSHTKTRTKMWTLDHAALVHTINTESGMFQQVA